MVMISETQIQDAIERAIKTIQSNNKYNIKYWTQITFRSGKPLLIGVNEHLDVCARINYGVILSNGLHERACGYIDVYWDGSSKSFYSL